MNNSTAAARSSEYSALVMDVLEHLMQGSTAPSKQVHKKPHHSPVEEKLGINNAAEKHSGK